MGQSKTLKTSTSSQLEDASMELLLVYENLSTIYNNACRLGECADMEKAAEVTLMNILDITQSTSGVFLILKDESFSMAAKHNVQDNVAPAAMEAYLRYQMNPYYEDSPVTKFHAEDYKEGVCSLYIPFAMDQDKIGVIFLFCTQFKEYTSIDIKFSQILGSQGALTIQRFIHLEEIKAKNLALEEALEQLVGAQAELVKKERLSAVGEMASLIVHDLKNPMGGILGYAQLMETLFAELSKDQVKEYSGNIVKETIRLSNMVEEIVDFSRDAKVILNPREINAKNLTALVSPEILPLCREKEIRFQWINQDEDRYFYADTDKLKSALVNLASNACNSMDHGGFLEISTRHLKDKIEFAVKDTGCGFSPEITEKLFEPFATRVKGKNLGLGLALAKWIVEAHNGHIWLHSTDSQGAQMRFSLPIMKNQST